MNLADGATFPTALIEREKLESIKKINFCVAQSNRYGFSRYCMIYMMEIFLSKENFSVEYQNLLDYHMSGSRKCSSMKRHSFTIYCLMSHKTAPLNYTLDIKIHLI